jgi:hypothetical protein
MQNLLKFKRRFSRFLCNYKKIDFFKRFLVAER